MRPLVWFRSDLRVRDNTALARACRVADDGVVGVFVVCPEQWRRHDWADIRVDFVLRNLAELSKTLARLGIPLLLEQTPTFAGVPGVLDRLATRHGCDALYFNREYEVNETRRDAAVSRVFLRRDRPVHGSTDQVILAPGSVLTRDDGWYKVFTPFKRAWLETLAANGPVETQPLPARQKRIGVEGGPVPDAVAGFDRDAGRPDLWPAGETHAGERLSSFVEHRLAAYHDRRDSPADDGTSALSPYLTSGVISPRACLAAAMDAGRRSNGAAAWIDELIWREFYKHVMVGFPRVCMNKPFRRETARIRWRTSMDDFRAWCDGRTGFPIVDAAMRRLNATGWMHNRLRMITATFLAKHLLLDWRWGERYFMSRLVDGDLSANNGGWQWSASTGTDAAPYFRILNPIRQGLRHDPEARFIRANLPELSGLDPEMAHEPWRLPRERRRTLDYPEPICDLGATRTRAIEAFVALRR